MIELFFFLFTTLVSTAYIVLILRFAYGFWKTNLVETSHVNLSTKAVVIVAARNEEDTIVTCLKKLVNQTYAHQNFEIIVVDDFSEDNTASLVTNYSKQYKHIKFLQLADYGQKTGKKAAIELAIEHSQAEIVITTDADCEMGPCWLQSIVSSFQDRSLKMLVGPVCFQGEKNGFEKMQSLEFMALVASGAGALHHNKAIMCNGANLAYKRAVFLDVGGFDGVDKIPTGDDVLLMYKVHKKYPLGIDFIMNTDTIVYTKAKETLTAFIEQRRRWASKGVGLLNATTTYTSVIVYAFALVIMLIAFLAIVGVKTHVLPFEYLNLGITLFSLKAITDFLLLFLATSFFQKKRLLLYFPIELPLYIIYVVFIASTASFVSYSWKGRVR